MNLYNNCDILELKLEFLVVLIKEESVLFIFHDSYIIVDGI